MKTTVEQVGANSYKLTVEASAADLKSHFDATYRRLARDMRIPGFRPGKAPKPIITRSLGEDYIRDEVLRAALPELVSQAVTESNIDIVAPPEISVTSFSEELVFDAVLETKPEIVLGPWRGMGIEKPDSSVTDEDVDEQIDELRKRLATVNTVERAAATGDIVVADLTTVSAEGETDAGLTADDVVFELGTAMFVPELDTELEGRAAGDEVTLTAELPEKFGERSGSTVTITAKVKEVRERVLPELDDEFAQSVSEHDTVEDLKAAVKDRSEKMRASNAEAVVKDRAATQLVELVEVELSPGMLRMEQENLLEQFARGLAQRGVKFEEWLEHENIDFTQALERFADQASSNIKFRLALEKIIADEELEATEDDRSEYVNDMALRTGMQADEILQRINTGSGWDSIDGDILRSKALELVVEQATLTQEGSQ